MSAPIPHRTGMDPELFEPSPDRPVDTDRETLDLFAPAVPTTEAPDTSITNKSCYVIVTSIFRELGQVGAHVLIVFPPLRAMTT